MKNKIKIAAAAVVALAVIFAVLIFTSKDDTLEVNITDDIESVAEPSPSVLEAYKFSEAGEYGDTVYVTRNLTISEGVQQQQGNVSTALLPAEAYTDESIASFTIYNDKIYYVAGEGGSDILRANIYVSDISGNNAVCIATDTYNDADCFIYDGYLYYEVCRDSTDEIGIKYNLIEAPVGICKINLDTLEKTMLMYEETDYCDLIDCYNNILLYSLRSISGINRWYDTNTGNSGIYNGEVYSYHNSTNDISFYTGSNNDSIHTLYINTGEDQVLIPADGSMFFILNVTDKYVYYEKSWNDYKYMSVNRVEIPER